jgi:hypothetical protein
VERHLSGYVAVRKVDGSGHVSIYDRRRSVGAQYRGQHALVQYDPDRHEWLLCDRDGRAIRRHEAPEISRASILTLNFRKPRKKR